MAWHIHKASDLSIMESTAPAHLEAQKHNKYLVCLHLCAGNSTVYKILVVF